MPILSGVRNLTKSIVGGLFTHLLWILSRQKINIKTWALHNITDLIFEILKTLGSIIGGQQRNNGMDSPVLKVRKYPHGEFIRPIKCEFFKSALYHPIMSLFQVSKKFDFWSK